MKSSRSVRNYFQIAAMQRRTFSLLSAGIVMVVMISLVASAQSPSAAPADDKSIRPLPRRHFAAWEQPELFTQELRAAFKSVRQ